MKLGFLDFFRDVSNFFKGGSVLGVDIGTASIKAVELGKRGEEFELKNYSILETSKYLTQANQAIQTSSLKISREVGTDLLKTLIREMKPKTNLAVASLPLFAGFVTVIELPILSKEETERAVMFQARQYIPIPIEQVAVEWYPIERFETSHGRRYQRVLLIGIPKEIIERYKDIFKEAGLKLISLEIESFSLLRAVEKFITDVPVIVVDIGAQSTNTMILERKSVKMLDQTDYSGIYITQALSKSLDISMIRAEDLKRRKGIGGLGRDAELSTLLLPFLDVIIQETRHVKDSFERKYGTPVERLMLVGGGANLKGLDKYVARQLGVTMVHQSPISSLKYPATLEPAIGELNNTLPVALGLAKKYFTS